MAGFHSLTDKPVLGVCARCCLETYFLKQGSQWRIKKAEVNGLKTV